MPRTPPSPAVTTFRILTAASAGMTALLALLPAAGHDQMWLLYAARLVLSGAPIYGPQIFETNPPLIIWLSLIPAGVARLTHLPDTAWGKCFTLVTAFAIAALCLNLLRRIQPYLTRLTFWILAFAFVTIFGVMPARDFGQRDYFLILFLLPYVTAAALRLYGPARRQPGTAFAVLIGALAIAGVALKPHQVLIILAVELALLFVKPSGNLPRTRRLITLRPEILSMVLTGLVFLAAIRLFAPLYFSVILPGVGDTYWAYHLLTPLQLLQQSVQLHLLLLANLALAFLNRRRLLPLPRVLLLAGVAANVAFYLQGTGWYYQQLPALSLLALALIFLLLQFESSEIPHALPSEAGRIAGPAPSTLTQLPALPRWSPAAAAALSLLALALTTHFTNYPFTGDRSFPIEQPDPAFFANLPPGTPVMTLSPTVDDTIQPIFKYHLSLGQRYPAFLMLPALLRSEDSSVARDGSRASRITHHLTPTRLAQIDHMQRQDMLEDLDRWHPRLLLVERCQDPNVHCQTLEERHDDLLAFFLKDPAFTAAFAHYHLTRSIGPYDAYTLQQP